MQGGFFYLEGGSEFTSPTQTTWRASLGRDRTLIIKLADKINIIQMADIYLIITLGGTVHFADPDALKVHTNHS